MKKKAYEYEHTQGSIFVSGKYEEGEHRLFLGNKNSPMVLASLNPVHTQTPGNARRLAASWNACLPYEIDDLEETGSVGVCTLRLSQQRDELLVMLEEMVDGRDNVCGFDNPCTCRVCRGRALIAKIKEAYHVG